MNPLSSTILLILLPAILTQPLVSHSGIRTSPIIPRVPKIYEIDLDASYEDQWKAILTDFGPAILHYANNQGLYNEIPFDILDLIGEPVVELYDREFAEEMKAISSLLNMSFSQVVLLNLIYDFTAQCTSIIIQDDEDNVYHGRNLDFSDSEELSQLVFHGKYYKSGELLYEAIGLAGYSGMLTGLKPNAYSFSINQYLNQTEINATLAQNIMIAAADIDQAFMRALSPPILAKRAFQTIEDYNELVSFFNSTEVISNVFYIIAGPEPGQGTVMTRYRSTVQNITTLNVDAGDWYLVQTNYIGEDPAFDNRDTAARNWLDSIGRNNITEDLLLNQVLAVYPVFNNDTIHSTIMQPKTGYINTTIWGW